MRLFAGRSDRKHSRSLTAGLVLVVAVTAALGVLSGCSSFFSGSSSGSHVGYVAGGVTSVAAYRINNTSGSVTPLFSAPYVAGNSPSSVVVHPSGKFLYVANAIDNTISLFSIDSTTGALTEVLPRTPSGIAPSSMVMDGGGNFLFVADQGSNDVWAFQIGTAGALTQASSVSVGSSPGGLALTSSGFLFVPLPNFSAITVLSVGSGSLQIVGSFPVSNGVGGIAVDSGAKFLYATNPAINTVSGFVIQTGGSLTAVPGLRFGTGTTPVAAVVDLTGSYLYVANTGSGNVSQFTIDSATGTLTTITSAPTVSAGTNPAFVVTDPNGKFIYVGNTGSKSVTEYSINSSGSLTNGALTNLNTISVGFVPRSFALTP